MARIQMFNYVDGKDPSAIRRAFLQVADILHGLRADVDAPFKVPVVTADPADTPAEGTTRFNKTNGKLWLYDGAAWKSTTLS